MNIFSIVPENNIAKAPSQQLFKITTPSINRIILLVSH